MNLEIHMVFYGLLSALPNALSHCCKIRFQHPPPLLLFIQFSPLSAHLSRRTSLGAPLSSLMAHAFWLSTVKLHIALNLQYAHGRGVHLSGYAQSSVLGLLFAACSRSPAATSKGNTPSLRSWATLFGCSRLPWACCKKQAHINWVIILTNGHPSLEHITD